MKGSTIFKLIVAAVVFMTVFMVFSLSFPYWLLHITLAYFSAYVLLPICVCIAIFYYLKVKWLQARDRWQRQ